MIILLVLLTNSLISQVNTNKELNQCYSSFTKIYNEHILHYIETPVCLEYSEMDVHLVKMESRDTILSLVYTMSFGWVTREDEWEMSCDLENNTTVIECEHTAYILRN